MQGKPAGRPAANGAGGSASGRFATPELALWTAVIERALNDLADGTAGTRLRAERWIFEDPTGGFAFACHAAGLSKSWVRRLALRAMPAADGKIRKVN